MPGVRTVINVWSRRLHRWGAILTALPLLIVLCTGVLLLLKKELSWIQPPTAAPTQAGVAGVPNVSFEAILGAAASVEVASVSGWADISRVDLRPRDGVVKVMTRSGWEVQVCAATGAVLGSAVRRSDFIESLHDGSFFHPGAKLGVFLPSALVALTLWVTGIWMWLLPWLSRRR